MIREFQQLYPSVEFRLFNGDYHDVDRWLTEGSADVGFITLPTDLDCQTIPLAEDRLLAVLPADHPLAASEICSVRDVAREPFISLLETSDDDALRALDAAGVKPEIRFTTKDDYAIIAMVGKGMGVSIMPELLLRGVIGNYVAARPLDPPNSRMLALAVVLAGLAGVGAVVGIARAYMDTAPELDLTLIDEQAQTSFIYDAQKNLITD